MKERFWGEAADRAAAEQMGLEGDYTIFMMGCDADYVEDLQEVEDEFEKNDVSLCHPEEVIDAVQERVKSVKLPKGFALVGMVPYGAKDPKHYGVVDLSAHGVE